MAEQKNTIAQTEANNLPDEKTEPQMARVVQQGTTEPKAKAMAAEPMIGRLGAGGAVSQASMGPDQFDDNPHTGPNGRSNYESPMVPCIPAVHHVEAMRAMQNAPLMADVDRRIQRGETVHLAKEQEEARAAAMANGQQAPAPGSPYHVEQRVLAPTFPPQRACGDVAHAPHAVDVAGPWAQSEERGVVQAVPPLVSIQANFGAPVNTADAQAVQAVQQQRGFTPQASRGDGGTASARMPGGVQGMAPNHGYESQRQDEGRQGGQRQSGPQAGGQNAPEQGGQADEQKESITPSIHYPVGRKPVTVEIVNQPKQSDVDPNQPKPPTANQGGQQQGQQGQQDQQKAPNGGQQQSK